MSSVAVTVSPFFPLVQDSSLFQFMLSESGCCLHSPGLRTCVADGRIVDHLVTIWGAPARGQCCGATLSRLLGPPTQMGVCSAWGRLCSFHSHVSFRDTEVQGYGPLGTHGGKLKQRVVRHHRGHKAAAGNSYWSFIFPGQAETCCVSILIKLS